MMKNYCVKPIEHYIEKHGEEKGRRIWQTETKKAEKYNSQPYRRLTKEWFEWRYGPSEGAERFRQHVEKSRQTLENFIDRHGAERGKQVYDECMAKKATRTIESILRASPDLSIEEAQAQLEKMQQRWSNSMREYWDNLSPEQKEQRRSQFASRMKKTKIERYGTLSQKEILIQKHGAESSEVKNYLRSLFPTAPGQSSFPAMEIIKEIQSQIHNPRARLQYGDSKQGLSEYRTWDNLTERGYMFDLTIFVDDCIMVIMEYDGSGFHPTLAQVQENPSALMAGRKTRKHQWEIDRRKEKLACHHSERFYRIRSDDSEEQQQKIIHEIVEFINNV